MRALLLAAIGFVLPGIALAEAPAQFRFASPGLSAATSCVDAISGAERAASLPAALLLSIGVVESGRLDPKTGRVAPWPWTINVEGAGTLFETREEAIAAVQAARAAGRRSIDVGCMQVNLMHHPDAFADLQEAFDPRANATYAAGFLVALHGQFSDWGDAAAAYHSQTPGVSDDYRRRVVANWDGAARYGVVQHAGLVFAASRRNPAPLREPAGGYTPEFRARLAQDAADARALRVAMGIIPAGAPPARPARGRVMLASLRG